MFNFIIRLAAAKDFDLDSFSNSVLVSDPDCRTAFNRVLEYFDSPGSVARTQHDRIKGRGFDWSNNPDKQIPSAVINESVDLSSLRMDLLSSIITTKTTIQNAIEQGRWNALNGAKYLGELKGLENNITLQVEPREDLAQKYIMWFFTAAARFNEEAVKTQKKEQLTQQRLQTAKLLLNDVIDYYNRMVLPNIESKNVPAVTRRRDEFITRIQDEINDQAWRNVNVLVEDALSRRFTSNKGTIISYASLALIRLTKMADILDSQGKFAEANLVDHFIRITF